MGVPWSAGNKDMGLPSGYYSAHTVYFMCDVWPSHMVTSGYKMYSKDNNCGFWSQPLCLFSMEVGGGGRGEGGRGEEGGGEEGGREGGWGGQGGMRVDEGEHGIGYKNVLKIGTLHGILLLLVELELETIIEFTQGHFPSVSD